MPGGRPYTINVLVLLPLKLNSEIQADCAKHAECQNSFNTFQRECGFCLPMPWLSA